MKTYKILAFVFLLTSLLFAFLLLNKNKACTKCKAAFNISKTCDSLRLASHKTLQNLLINRIELKEVLDQLNKTDLDIAFYSRQKRPDTIELQLNGISLQFKNDSINNLVKIKEKHSCRNCWH